MDAWPLADCQGRTSFCRIFHGSLTALPVRKAELAGCFRFLNPQPPATGIRQLPSRAARAVNAGGICANKPAFPRRRRLIDKI
jgi:hypothetical protein